VNSTPAALSSSPLSRADPWVISLCLLVVCVPLMVLILDESAVHWVRQFHIREVARGGVYPVADRALRLVTHGRNPPILILGLLAAGLLLNRRLLEPAKVLLVTYVLSGSSAQLLKHLVGRARPKVSMSPVFIGPSIHGPYDSFPSGHTVVAFCLASVIARLDPRFRVPAYAFALLTAASRLGSAAHFPSDVVAGVLLGLLIGHLCLRYLLPRRGSAAPGRIAET
jgi:membrane-associated phospholipid phosphatase